MIHGEIIPFDALRHRNMSPRRSHSKTKSVVSRWARPLCYILHDPDSPTFRYSSPLPTHRCFESHEISRILGIVYCRRQMKGTFYAVSPFPHGSALEIKNLLTRRCHGDSLMRNRQWAFINQGFNPEYGRFVSSSTGLARTEPIHWHEGLRCLNLVPPTP